MERNIFTFLDCKCVWLVEDHKYEWRLNVYSITLNRLALTNLCPFLSFLFVRIPVSFVSFNKERTSHDKKKWERREIPTDAKLLHIYLLTGWNRSEFLSLQSRFVISSGFHKFFSPRIVSSSVDNKIYINRSLFNLRTLRKNIEWHIGSPINWYQLLSWGNKTKRGIWHSMIQSLILFNSKLGNPQS